MLDPKKVAKLEKMKQDATRNREEEEMRVKDLERESSGLSKDSPA